MAKLVVVSGDSSERDYVLEGVSTIGRHPDNTIQVLDRLLSKYHVEISRGSDGRYVLRDLESLNGTFVNGDRISTQVLVNNDEIQAGSVRFVFCQDEEQPRIARPGVALPLERVTISPTATHTHIQQRLAARPSGAFIPEADIRDTGVLREDYERLRIAYELSRAVGTELELGRLLEKIVLKAFDMLPADRGVILLKDPQGQLVPRIVLQRDGAAAEDVVLSTSILAEVMEKREAVISADAMVDSRFAGARSVILQGIRSTMCVPLLYGSDLLGIMHLDSLVATNAFTEQDLSIFAGIASQAAIAIHTARLAEEIKQEARHRAQLQRFFSPGLVDQIVSGSINIGEIGELRDVTCLFADIRGFTGIAERLGAREVVGVLNAYFELMTEVLFRYHGTLDKYVGDGIMALFGVPFAWPEASLDAVRCAQAMMKALEDFNRDNASGQNEPLQVGLGISSGPCVYGAIGSRRTLQYTAVGDPVNTASRLCAKAKGGEILVSGETHALVHAHVPMAHVSRARLKGKHSTVEIYRVSKARG